MQNDTEVRKAVFQTAVKHARRNTATAKERREHVIFFLSAASQQARDHHRYNLAFQFQEVARIVRGTLDLKSAWDELEQASAHADVSAPNTPASNTGVTDTGESRLIDYVAGVKS